MSQAGELDRVPAILADVERFAASARRVAARGPARFFDPEDDDQRRIARSLAVDLSAAADRLPEDFRAAHGGIDWVGIRATRNFVAHDYGAVDDQVLWQMISVDFPAVAAHLLGGPGCASTRRGFSWSSHAPSATATR
ncbi:MAG: DUF86 domain-containing protein [Bifidobacteriaceae bacterium]|nr:DUF86 domain-containing protein [Bifidobacteriaceae bacterium]